MLLGIDIGTSTCAAVVVDHDGAQRASWSIPHSAGSPRDNGRAEQDTGLLLGAAREAVRGLPAELRRAAGAIGVTGQMHGVVLVDAALHPLTPLVTWQDRRCLDDPAFVPAINARTGHRLRSGYGCATLARLVASGALPTRAASSGTIQALLVARLCGLPRPVTDPTDAAGWGLVSLAELDWDHPAVTAAGIPPALLPAVAPCGSVAGHLTSEAAADIGLPAGIPVCTAIGDNQASLLATLEHPGEELALTLGTGGQLSAVVADMRAVDDTDRPFEYRPYPGSRYLAVAASLCGGAAWAWLADTARAWCADLGLDPPSRDHVFTRLDILGLSSETTLTVRPHFLGERHDPALRGGIEGIDLTNMTLGSVARATAAGIARSFDGRLPPHALANRRAIVGSGNALRGSALLRHMVEETLGLPLRLGRECEEAAVGAALLARQGPETAPKRDDTKRS